MTRTSIAPRLQASPIASYDSASPQSAASPIDSPDTGITQIITSKQWVLPPRPKPGRKPSVDTPALKRKAQNRAAQRAFRERRATRVQELEEKLMEVEKEKEVKEMGLVNTIKKLKLENQFLLKNFEQLKADFNLFKDKNNQPVAQFKLFSLQNTNTANSPSNQSTGSPASSAYSVQQISPAPSADSPPVYFHQPAYKPSAFTPISNDPTPGKLAPTNFDCGVCVKEECLCETVGLKIPQTQEDLNKKLEDSIKSFKPTAAVSLALGKKRKSDDELEIDFTAKFTSKPKPMPDLKKLRKAPVVEVFNESSPVENCGFCSDDTPCVCREAAKEAAKEAAALSETLNFHEEEDHKKTLPPIQFNSNIIRKSSLPVMHPGPSVEIREIANLTPGAVPTVIKPTTRNNSSVPGTPTVIESMDSPAPTDGGCTGNPGTCQQCQMDPLSTLFCTTVANKENSDSPESTPVSTPQPKLPRTDSKTSLPSMSVTSFTNPSTPTSVVPPITQGIFIPCADAYKTLSRHKRFNSVDFSTLVGKLTTRGMQVEVQSVANVLRELDRRLHH